MAAVAAGRASLQGVCRRMNQLKNRESRMSLEDLMYVSVLDKFMELGVEMMPRLEVIPDSVSTIHALTSGIHSAEALDMVKDHVRTLLGPAEYVPPGTKLQLSKLQAAQVSLVTKPSLLLCDALGKWLVVLKT